MKKIKSLLLILLFTIINLSVALATDIDLSNIKIDKNGLIKQSCYKIHAIYPSANQINTLNDFPGNRGPHQLIIYKPEWSDRTGTNEFGKEAVVVNDVVVELTGADSIIPKNGYVISAHGLAKDWMNKNIQIGTKIKIEEENNIVRAYTTVDSYRQGAKIKIEEIEEVIKNLKKENMAFNEKKVRICLKDAKKYYRKSRGNGKIALMSAVESMKMSETALKYSLPYVESELRGVWLRPVEKTRAEVVSTLEDMKKIGINAIFLETYFHGKTIFPSDTMDKYGFNRQNRIFNGEDILAYYIQEAHKRNIQVHVWFESFYIGNVSPSVDEKNILAVKPEWGNKNKINADSTEPVFHPTEHKGYFLDPANPEVTTFLKELITEISAKYAIDGFNIDYIRYPQTPKNSEEFYETSSWGYTKYAREEFKSRHGVDPVQIKCNSQMWREWDRYRQGKINSYIKSLKNILKYREIMVSAVIFPDEEQSKETKQQNWSEWAEKGYIDALTPLILTSDNKLSKKMMKEVKKKAKGETKVYPGIFVGFMDGEPEDLIRQIHNMRTLNLGGIILFDYAHLDKKYTNYLDTSVFSTVSD